jgi:recombinational DNA repair protein (RecF pathway)
MEVNMEKCVTCGVETDVPIDTPVDVRYNYVEGAGQLCKSCWEKVYKK